MNWIIRNTEKLKFHTNLDVLLKPIEDDIHHLKWLVTDLEINTSELQSLPINHDKDWFLISAEEMNRLRNSDSQIVWGVFSGLEKNIDINPDEMDLPLAEESEVIWKAGNLQTPFTKIEIIAYDSSYTIVKFADADLSEKFKSYFNEAIELEKYKW